MGQAQTSERGFHEKPTGERLSSLIQQKGLTGTRGARDDCYWVLLAESSADRFVVLEGIHQSCWTDAHNGEFQLVAVGSAHSEDGCAVFWPGAKDLACAVHKLMRKKKGAANESKILEEAAGHGLLIYHLDGCEARFGRPAVELQDESWVISLCISYLGAFVWMEEEMQMLSRVLKPPSVLGAVASPSLLAQGPLDDAASSSSAPLALVSVGTDNNPSEAAGAYAELPESELVMYSPFGNRIYRFPVVGHQPTVIQGCYSTYRSGDNMNMIMTTIGDGNNTGGHSLRDLLQQHAVAAAPLHVFTRSSGGPRGRNGGGLVVHSAAAEFYRRWWRDYDLEAQRHLDYDLEAAGGRAHRAAATAAAADGAQRRAGRRAAAPVQEPSEVPKMLAGVMVQAYAASIPLCVTAYPVLRGAPDYVKLTIFGGLAFTTVGLFVGILSRSVARRRLAMRLVSFLAIAVLTFSLASQLSSRTYIALTALVGVALNLIIMLLPL